MVAHSLQHTDACHLLN